MSSPTRHHIPFPSYWLSLNARPTKVVTATPSTAVTTMPPEELPVHGFLSNKPSAPRSFSVSSTSTVNPNSAPNTPPTKAADASPVAKEAVPAIHSFLTLNTKPAVPQKVVAADVSPVVGTKHSFLSNKS